MDIFVKANRISKTLGLTGRDVTGEGWNTSVPKLIDNAIIGLFKHLERKSPGPTLGISCPVNQETVVQV